MPSVRPASAGPIVAPAIAVATCDSVTGQKPCHIQMMIAATMDSALATATMARRCGVASTSAPAGVVTSMPTMPPMVSTVPMRSGVQPCACR